MNQAREYLHSILIRNDLISFKKIVTSVDQIQVDVKKMSADEEQRKKQIILNHITAFNENKNKVEIESAIKIIDEISIY